MTRAAAFCDVNFSRRMGNVGCLIAIIGLLLVIMAKLGQPHRGAARRRVQGLWAYRREAWLQNLKQPP